MSSPAEAIGAQEYRGSGDHSKDFVALVVSRWNPEITEALAQGAETTLRQHGVQRIVRFDVPGAYELPQAAAHVAGKAKFDAIICLGCVIKGETAHDQYISQAVASGLMNLSFFARRPVLFGVLTPNNEQQARERAGGIYGNKGAEAAVAALEMIDLWRSSTETLKGQAGNADTGGSRIGFGFGPS